MKYKGLISLMLFIAMIAALTFTMTKFQLASAFPSKTAYCNSCHPSDTNTWISVTVDSETESDITYYVSGSDNYNGEEGWAVFDPAGNNIANGYNPGYFTLPKDGKTYRVYWVDDANNDPTAPDPGKGGSTFTDIITPVIGVHDIAVTNVVLNVTEAYIGETVRIDVVVANEGTESETFNVYVYADTDTAVIGDEITIDIITSASLEAGASTTLSVTWDTTDEGVYTISAKVPPVPSEENTADNLFSDETVTVSPVPLQPPDASFTWLPLEPVVGEEVTFTSTSTDSGVIVSWEWDFNGDGVIDATTEIAYWTYDEAGTHTVSLTVTDDDSLTDITHAEITVSPAAAIHDIAVINVTVAPTQVVESEEVSITVDLLNEGTVEEIFDVGVYYDSVLIEIRTGVFVAAGATTTLTFRWNTTAVAEGTYTISVEASIAEGELDTADNTFIDGTVAITTPAILSVTVDFDPDTLNLKSMGKWVTCYIELTEGYGVQDINVSTILLEDFIPAETDSKYGFVSNPEIKDRDGDGISELMVKFDRQAVIEYIRDVLGIIDEHVTLRITGELRDSTLFEGVDTIKVISQGQTSDGTSISSINRFREIPII